MISLGFEAGIVGFPPGRDPLSSGLACWGRIGTSSSFLAAPSVGLSTLQSATAVSMSYDPAASEPGWPFSAAVAGCRLGRYVLVERLGQGCQGEVWKAIHGSTVFEEVAIKLLPPNRALEPKRLAQFRREAERGARLTSPSLLPTYEYGEAHGVMFMVMPLVEGCSLGAVIAERRAYQEGRTNGRLHPLVALPEAEYFRSVARLVARVAHALEVAHAARVSHRDVKPTNILLDRKDGVFLCDFGLGRDLDVATPAQLRDGAGTPLYMAPERLLRFHSDEVRADIYALGATLFEALALVPPTQVPEGLAWPAWSAYLAEARPPAPRSLRPGIAVDLETIVLRAMERNPHRRYPSAAEMAGDLERFLAGEPVLARRSPPSGPCRHGAAVESRAGTGPPAVAAVPA